MQSKSRVWNKTKNNGKSLKTFEKQFAIEVNIKRWYLNKFPIAELGYKLEEVEGEQAKKRKETLIWLEL